MYFLTRHLYGDQAAFFEAEIKPRIKHTRRGLVSMVNDGNGMHGSQVCSIGCYLITILLSSVDSYNRD